MYNPRLFSPLHFLPPALQLSLLPARQFRLLSNYVSFLSTPSLCCLLGAEGPFIREEGRSVGEKSCVCVHNNKTLIDYRQSPLIIKVHVNLSIGSCWTKHLLIGLSFLLCF